MASEVGAENDSHSITQQTISTGGTWTANTIYGQGTEESDQLYVVSPGLSGISVARVNIELPAQPTETTYFLNRSSSRTTQQTLTHDTGVFTGTGYTKGMRCVITHTINNKYCHNRKNQLSSSIHPQRNFELFNNRKPKHPSNKTTKYASSIPSIAQPDRKT